MLTGPADAYHRHGPYYPKLLCAVPFTPVSGQHPLRCAPPSARSCWWRR
jgi:predicted N-acyltransferase